MIPELEAQLTDLRRRIAADPALAGLEILPHLRPSVRLTVERVDLVALGLGETRIGGVPDMPPGFEWPWWEPIHPNERMDHPCHPTPLSFIAQIDFASVPRIDDALPEQGWLYFFYDCYCYPEGGRLRSSGGWRVLYADCERNSVERIDAPEETDRRDHLRHFSNSCRVQMRPEWTLPDLELFDPDDQMSDHLPYCELCRELEEVAGRFQNRLLGHSQNIQWPMELRCQSSTYHVEYGTPKEAIAALGSGTGSWRLLLQIDSDEAGPGWMWHDIGRVYVWIREEDLRALNFDDVCVFLQST